MKVRHIKRRHLSLMSGTVVILVEPVVPGSKEFTVIRKKDDTMGPTITPNNG